MVQILLECMIVSSVVKILAGWVLVNAEISLDLDNTILAVMLFTETGFKFEGFGDNSGFVTDLGFEAVSKGMVDGLRAFDPLCTVQVKARIVGKLLGCGRCADPRQWQNLAWLCLAHTQFQFVFGDFLITLSIVR